MGSYIPLNALEREVKDKDLSFTHNPMLQTSRMHANGLNHHFITGLDTCMVFAPINPPYSAKVALLKKPLWGSHTASKLHPTWQDFFKPEVGCVEVDSLQLMCRISLTPSFSLCMLQGKLKVHD
jgi:hypothetical protein